LVVSQTNNIATLLFTITRVQMTDHVGKTVTLWWNLGWKWEIN